MIADLRPAERLFFAALAVYVTVLPISGTMAVRSITFALLVGVTAWQAIRGRLRLDLPLAGPWVAYAAVAVVSLLYAVDPAYSLGEIKVEIVYCIVIFAMAASWFRSVDRLLWLVWIVVGGNLLFVVGSAWTAIRGEKVLLGAWDTGVGSTATVIATVLPWIAVLAMQTFAQRRRRATFFLIGLCLANLGALALTMNRQGWLALAVSLAIAAVLAGRAFWTRPRLLVAGAVAALFLALFAALFLLRAQHIAEITHLPKEETAMQAGAPIAPLGKMVETDVRWRLWRFSLERIAERPLSGGGFGREAFKMLFPDYYRDHLQIWHAHNMVINKGIQMGLPGMATFLVLWIALAAACAKGLRVPSSPPTPQPPPQGGGDGCSPLRGSVSLAGSALGRPGGGAGLRPWAIATLAMIAGVFVRNMVDDFFIRDHALLFWLLCGAYLGVLRQATQAEGKAG
jgi:O-antigen ligase